MSGHAFEDSPRGVALLCLTFMARRGQVLSPLQAEQSFNEAVQGLSGEAE